MMEGRINKAMPDQQRKMADPSMHLPIGETCSDCVHFKRCQSLFGCPVNNVTCDFSPSCFKKKPEIAA